MAITWADVTGAFPNDATLAAVDAGAEGVTYIAWVEQQVDDGTLEERADQVRTLLAAHLATVVASGGFGASGPVVSESVDGVSRSYASPAAVSPDGMAATSYGRRALMLMNISPLARLPGMY